MDKEKLHFQLLSVDAWQESYISDNGKEYTFWYWNNSYTIAYVNIRAGADEKRAFMRALKKHGVSCVHGACKIDYTDDCYELIERKTGRPLFAFRFLEVLKTHEKRKII